MSPRYLSVLTPAVPAVRPPTQEEVEEALARAAKRIVSRQPRDTSRWRGRNAWVRKTADRGPSGCPNGSSPRARFDRLPPAIVND
jgi:hypothetical protein